MDGASDCIIVGGGVVGMMAALRLRDAGVGVTVVDRGAPGQEASWAAAGILAPQVEAHGPGPVFELLRESCRRWPALADELRSRGGVDVGYRDEGTLVVAGDDAAAMALQERMAWQVAAGLPLEQLDRRQLHEREPSLAAAPLGFWLPADRQVDNRALVRALAAACVAAGVELVRAEVRRVRHDGRRVLGVELDEGLRAAGHVVVAAGAWSAQLDGSTLPAGAVFPVRGQMLELRPEGRPLRHVVFGAGGYLVPRGDGRVLCGSTEELAGFERVTTPAAQADLEARAARLCPTLADARVADRWAGLRPASRDGLPYIGTTAIAGLYLASGHFRNGVVLSPLTGAIVAALVTGAPPPTDLKPLSPSRR